MTGEQALGILILKKKPIRMRIWPQGERIVWVDSAARSIVQVDGRGLTTTYSIDSFPWEDDDWELYEPKIEQCTFLELFDKLKPGDHAVLSAPLMDRKIHFHIVDGALKLRSHGNDRPLPDITKKFLDSKFWIYRGGDK